MVLTGADAREVSESLAWVTPEVRMISSLGTWFLITKCRPNV
jgi:hypothetical protein